MEWGMGEGGGSGRGQAGRTPFQPTHRFRTEEEYNAYLRVAHESVEVGKETLSALAGQSEDLDRATTVAAASQYNIDKSARVLRGMTWWGSIQNWFSEEPVAPRPHKAAWVQQQERQGGGAGGGRPVAATAGDFRTGSFASLTEDVIEAKAATAQAATGGSNMNYHQPPQSYRRGYSDVLPSSSSSSLGGSLSAKQRQERDELFLTRSTGGEAQRPQQAAAERNPPVSLSEVQRIQDDHLSKLSVLLDEQRRVGGTLHTALTEQNGQIEDLEGRTERLHDSTRAVIRKAAKLSQGSWSDKPKVVGRVAFREVKTGLFLTVRGDEVRLLERHLCRPCQFVAYTCQSSITGFQSALTHLWLGQTMLGDLKVRGTHLGRNESFEIDWSQTRRQQQQPPSSSRGGGGTFIMSYSANWGKGGYLTLAADGSKVVIGGYGPKDKEAAARFEVIDCDEYTEGHLVNEICVKQPPSSNPRAALP